MIELLVVISIIALLIGLLLPALGAARQAARQMASNTQLRSIHQGMVVFAQENKGRYPGLLPNSSLTGNPANIAVDQADIDQISAGGSTAGFTVNGRYLIMLDRNLKVPEVLLSPAETFVDSGGAWIDYDPNATYNHGNEWFSSYSMSPLGTFNQIDEGRIIEWTETSTGGRS